MAKRKPLRVPLYAQPPGTGWCLPVAARMVMAFHGDEVPLEKIVREMKVPFNGGIDEMTAAMYLLRRGYKVRIVGWGKGYPASFSRIRGELPPKRFLAWAERETKDPDMFRKACKRYAREFIELGGVIETRATSLRDIRSALKRKEPPIVFVNVTTLWHRDRNSTDHAVVPVGTTNVAIAIFDPSPAQGKKNYDMTVFLHAFYRSDGVALFITPKR